MKDVIRKAQLSIVYKVYIPKQTRKNHKIEAVNGSIKIVRCNAD